MAMLVSCAGCTSEPSTYEPSQLTELTEDWEIALAEYLAQFLPIFHNIRHVETEWWSGWVSDWDDFIELLDVGYVYRNPITGERLTIDDVPFLNQRFDTWYDDDGERHTWSATEIATHFDLFDFDGSGIPALVIYWSSPHYEVIHPVTLHHFRNGAFEFVDYLSTYRGVDFFRADDGRLLISYHSTVASMIDLRLLYLNNEITTEPALSTDGWTGTVHNHLTGEYFGRDEPWGNFVGIGDADSLGELLVALLGFNVTRIEPLADLQEQFIKRELYI